MTFRWRTALLISTFITVAAACGPTESVPPELADAPGYDTRVFYLEAPCEVNVEGVGMVDVEEEYIPGVVACENGSAPTEALKAQAVQARSFLYYKLFVAGATTIANDQSDQVYSCSYRPNGPGPEHIAAAQATKGQYLTWEDKIVASFYVAGAIPPNPDPNDPWNSCLPNGGNDPTSTQQWVTYNRGKTGCDIDLTNLGFVPADCRDNPHNRGCASQNGETCLANAGVAYQDMFAYHYGDDIVIAVGEGRCGGDPPLSPEDQFCTDNGDGAHCLDAATRIECADGAAQMTETCDEGCSEGTCVVPVEPTFCTGKPDGQYCNSGSAVVFDGEMIVTTEVCPTGCTEGTCNAEQGTNNGVGGSNNDVGGSNNDANTNNATGGPGGNDDDGARPPGAVDDSGLPPVVGLSAGVSGGCSTAPDAPPPAAVWTILGLFGLFAVRRREQ